jgi:hypothetical protein
MILAGKITLVALAFSVGASWPTPDPPMPHERFTDIAHMRHERCLSTAFGAGSGSNPTEGGVALGLGRHVGQGDHGIAHRRAPMGSRARICLNGRCLWVPVIDRCPYGCELTQDQIKPGQACRGAARKGRRWCTCARGYRRPESDYRGCADLAPATIRALGHNGRQEIDVWTEI